jgi:hypothetical protein
MTRRKGRTHDVAPELLASVAAQYRELGGTRGAVNHLADIHKVHRTTIWRWLARAGVNRKRPE